MAHAMEHCERPWWKRPPVWVIAILAVSLVSFFLVERAANPTSIPYSTFLDELEAGRMASVTLNGTEIVGQLKVLPENPSSGSAQPTQTVRSRVPEIGDPRLIQELREQRVAIHVASPSAWSWLLGRIPWPMLILVGAMLVAASVRLLRGGVAQPGSGSPAMPAHGMIGLLSGLFMKQQQTESPHMHDHGDLRGP